MLTLKSVIFLVCVLVIYVIGFGFAFLVNSDFGNLDVNRFSISGEQKIAALIYKPEDVSPICPVPGVVLCHGISGSKEMMSQIALELARNGFVAVMVDLVGHGDSGGSLGGFGFDPKDKTLGVGDAVQYLIEQDYVNSSAIGVVGHSLGAGAVRAAALVFDNITASVFIGGGLGENIKTPEYGVLSPTFPKNLLIVIGKHDVLFDLEKTKNEVRLAFGNVSEVVTDEVYGNFSDFTARSLVVPETTHLFEPADPVVVSEVVSWMKNTLGHIYVVEESGLTYLNREFAIGVSFISFIVLVFPFSSIIFNRFSLLKKTEKVARGIGNWRLMFVWGVLGLGLFLPMFFVGSQIPFPLFVFGNSFAWWLLATAIAGLVIGKFVLPKFTSIKFDLKSTIVQTLTIKNIVTATGIFIMLYTIVYVAQSITFNELKIIILPIFKSLTNPSRVIGFFSLIPFYLIYFFVEGVYFHQFRISQKGSSSSIKDLIKIITIKAGPYITLILVNYVPMFLFNIRVFPSFAGFIMEFVLGIIPLFIITICYSWWFFRETNNIGIGVFLNTLLFAWSSAAIFPLSFQFG
jgi:dienelactone hydrolase